MDGKVEGSGLGDNLDQSNSGEFRWQRVKKNLFLYESVKNTLGLCIMLPQI